MNDLNKMFWVRVFFFFLSWHFSILTSAVPSFHSYQYHFSIASWHETARSPHMLKTTIMLPARSLGNKPRAQSCREAPRQPTKRCSMSPPRAARWTQHGTHLLTLTRSCPNKIDFPSAAFGSLLLDCFSKPTVKTPACPSRSERQTGQISYQVTEIPKEEQGLRHLQYFKRKPAISYI